MVPLGVENSNSESDSPDDTHTRLIELCDALQDWEHQLKHADIDFEELGL